MAEGTEEKEWKAKDGQYRRQPPVGVRAKGRRNFAEIAGVLPQVLRKLGLDQRLKEQTFINLWPHIIGEPFGSRSRPIFFDHERNIVVAVKDASTGQEMTFEKVKLVKAIRQAARGVGIEITGMRFDLKRYGEQPPDPPIQVLPDPSRGLPEPTAGDLAELKLSDEQYKEIADIGVFYKAAQPDAQPALISRVQTLFEKEMRLRAWRESKGYPHCSKCGDVTARLHGTTLICAHCFAADMS